MTVLSPEAQEVIRRGSMRGVVETIENGQVKIRRPSIRWNPRTERVELKPEMRRPTPVPQSMVDRMHDLPPEIRQSPRQRYSALVQRLVKDARTFSHDGRVIWPESVVNELKAAGWRNGNPNLWEEVELLARRVVETGANKQREQDNKRVALDWSGHYTA